MKRFGRRAANGFFNIRTMQSKMAIILALNLGGAGYTDETKEEIGDWSAPQRHLQARFVGRHKSEYIKGWGWYSKFFVDMELRNTAPARTKSVVKVDIDPATDITCRVEDECGRVVEPDRIPFRSTPMPGVHRLVLPADSRQRVPLTLDGAGVWTNQTILDVSIRQGAWYFDSSIAREFRLHGVLRVPASPGQSDTNRWMGELQIPPVTLRIPGTKAGQTTSPDRSQPSRPETNRTTSTAGFHH